MIFSRKYVFETKRTRLLRRLFNVAFLFVLILGAFCTFCIYLPIHGRNASSDALNSYYKKAPDLIAIFTGDQGRIPFGVDFSKMFPSAKIYISGVKSTNSAVNIIQHDDSDVVNFIEIDYSAQNTIQNVETTLKYLRENRYFKDVLIVSSDYHILRIRMLLNDMKTLDDQFNFNFYGIKTNYSDTRNIKKLLIEYIKFYKSLFYIITNG